MLTRRTGRRGCGRTRSARWRRRAPIYIWHGFFDEILPYGQDAALWKTYCRKGGKVTFQGTWDEHVSGMIGAGRQGAVQFLADRFAGKPATDNCWLSGA